MIAFLRFFPATIDYLATEVFAEKGYDAAGIDEIAKRANLTKPLIYYYLKER